MCRTEQLLVILLGLELRDEECRPGGKRTRGGVRREAPDWPALAFFFGSGRPTPGDSQSNQRARSARSENPCACGFLIVCTPVA